MNDVEYLYVGHSLTSSSADKTLARASKFSAEVLGKSSRRKCDCGKHTFGAGECNACKSHKSGNGLAYSSAMVRHQNINVSTARVGFPDSDRPGLDADNPMRRPTDPLPYRQATELAECIRIMGQENAAHCREVVLGEEPASAPTSTPSATTPPTTSPSAAQSTTVSCNPTALTRAQYLASPGTTTTDLGLTTLSGTVTVPAVHTNRTRRGRVVSRTSAALPPITSVFTGAGRFIEGQAIFAGGGSGGCRSGRYDLRWSITRGGAQKIRAGEMEHCSDFQHAFNISLQRFATAVNSVAQSGRVFPSQRAAERHIERLVGKAPADWASTFQCLAQKTLLRDGQGGSRGSHTPIVIRRPPELRRGCRFAEALITGRSLPQVGQRSSSQLIRGC